MLFLLFNREASINLSYSFNNAVGLAIDHRLLSEHPYDDTELLKETISKAVSLWGVAANRPRKLETLVTSDDVVLIKPNWVNHTNPSDQDIQSLITAPSILLAVVEQVARAHPKLIVIGDAPIQSCDFLQIATENLLQQLHNATQGVSFSVVDFRGDRWINPRHKKGINHRARPPECFVEFDLAVNSLLQNLGELDCNYRVSSYDHRILQANHKSGVHKYLMCKELFDATIVISLPKLKTHKLAGITGALKNIVGCVGHKAFLPHYRLGGSTREGDSYEGWSILRMIGEWLVDRANTLIGSPAYPLVSFLARGMSFVARQGGNTNKSGGLWYGNDTVWRMTIDIHRIAIYGDDMGHMHDSPRRKHFYLTDAILAGQGKGPLRPDPLKMGFITFADSPVSADILHAQLMGFDPSLIPSIRQAMYLPKWKLCCDSVSRVMTDQGLLQEKNIEELSVKAIPHPGWLGHIEKAEYDD